MSINLSPEPIVPNSMVPLCKAPTAVRPNVNLEGKGLSIECGAGSLSSFLPVVSEKS